MTMDVEDEEDFYSPEPSVAPETSDGTNTTTNAGDSHVEREATGSATPAPTTNTNVEPKTELELEEGEEEDEEGPMDEDDDDSDIEIVTERKDGTKAAPPTQSRYSDIRNIPQRSASNDVSTKQPPASKSPQPKIESPAQRLAVPSADKAAAAASSSKIDINGNPIYTPTGKHITAINIDEDLPDNEKPWRKPGTDISDYFNYGFDEFTWALYAAKQEAIRNEYNPDLMMAGNKKMMEDFGSMMMMGGMNMPGAAAPGPQPGGPAQPGMSAMPSMGAMPGMEGMPPDMQAMMQQMMASGMDPSQMDPGAMSAMFAGMQNQGAAAAAAQGGGQGQGFGQGGGGFGAGGQGMGQLGTGGV
ncbi:Fip1-domain-containing protein [Sodiomyces alkalinus F11]|uniref:Fip1-domain-containing protein n=1 Tax=Sodiomyces alkalinus (strain CBS 110278 / VKM F-3762 / F11) TaxID=1314773 RepID=A0A3N2Q5C8_SODAK|nr:Fip1-domain-containing protein [Sodiomyces alkalinus F11]ROT41962.1 Fip1-domain-containing protein [Sodiomyces alkalinus F11]